MNRETLRDITFIINSKKSQAWYFLKKKKAIIEYFISI